MAFNRSMGMLSGDPRYDLGAPTTSMGVGQQLGGMFGRFAGQAVGRDMRSSEQIQKATTGKAVQAALSSGDPMKVREIAGQIASTDATLALKLLDIAKKMESDKAEQSKLAAKQQVVIGSIQASDMTDQEKAETIKLYASGVIGEEDVLKRTGFIAGKPQEGFTLGEGQTRFDAQGNPIAEGKPKEKEPKIVRQPVVTDTLIDNMADIIEADKELFNTVVPETSWFSKDRTDIKNALKGKASEIALEQAKTGDSLAKVIRRVFGGTASSTKLEDDFLATLNAQEKDVYLNKMSESEKAAARKERGF